MKVIAKRIRVASMDNVDELFSSLCAQGLTPTLVPPLPPAHVTPLISLKPFMSLEEASAWLLRRAEEENERCLLAGGGQESPLCPDATTPSQRRWRGARRVVAACLLTPELQPLSLAFKQPEVHPSYHAEWALLDALSRDAHARGTSLPSSLTLLSTLKPCKLCAGAWASYGPEHLDVHYLADDPGRSGQNTAFDEGSYAWTQAMAERTL
jgi:tRNA(Arg) A34 adenosine deaminase TadA